MTLWVWFFYGPHNSFVFNLTLLVLSIFFRLHAGAPVSTGQKDATITV